MLDYAYCLQRKPLKHIMSMTVETTVSSVLPCPTHFAHAEQSFSLKKRRPPFSSSSTSNSSVSSPAHLAHSLPPLPPSKECPSVSRVFLQKTTPWKPLSSSLSQSPPPESVYDPKKQQSYFDQCFTTLSLLGRGSFGEVYKVQSVQDGRQYAVKRFVHRYRGNSDRNRKVREATDHERVCPHPHILNLVAAWEECGRLYIQTELCRTSLLLHAENQPPETDEGAAWAYLCDLLSALDHLHSHGFVHLDIKPANVLVTDSGCLKLGDFGLLLDLKGNSSDVLAKKVREDDHGGDPRYMAPELLRDEYGPAADVFSLGVSILELACSIEVPNGGEGWQQLRQGCLPQVTRGLSADLQSVLQMMLAPEPSERPTVSELLALPSVRKHRWKRRVYLLFAETMLTWMLLWQLMMNFGRRLLSFFHLPFLPGWSKPAPCTPPREHWDKEITLPLSAIHDNISEDDDAFMVEPVVLELSTTDSHRMKFMKSTFTPLPHSPAHDQLSQSQTPSRLNPFDWSPSNCAHTPSSIQSSDCHTMTPSYSPCHSDLYTDRLDVSSRQSRQSSQRHDRSWIHSEEALSRPSFEPKNLLCLFEETTKEGQP
ncbi:membrane-associated tyrosine- and threonine-specific cdc2-inhibitory kinase isoform X2 [Dunckerocampus dactyliophorus]|uniref:membrane-associated tyrosine- and threonine-specific cdc2-inhibitory kinase isoform X2 n=1 Tax=Dunckerocampus dactyliophorus TaxID=161453 RepID=UPI0024064F3F|nr:membrane-associated tyrosine- and threonine-specific cdc2-inhibitory kinase isoform X2 [Dunckerocampus dactyliophorus]